MDALIDQVQDSARRPWQLQRVAWAAAGALTVDDGTSAWELGALARAELGPVTVLPVGEPVNDTLLRFPTDATHAALAAAGMACDS